MASKIPPERLDEVERRLLCAEAPGDIERALSKEWSRTRRQIRKYIVIVRGRLAARAKTRTPDVDAEMVRTMLLDAFRTAKTGGMHGPDAKGMVQAAKTYGEVTGIIGPQRLEITGKNGGAIQTIASVVMMPALDNEPSAADDSLAP